MPSKKINFINKKGINLSGNLELPDVGKAHNIAIFAHCFTCNKNLKAVRHISKALQRKGFGVLSFDFTGLGDSEGEFINSNFSSNLDDLRAAADYLAEQYSAPTILIGHSLGGAAVLAVAQYIDSIKAIATIGAPFSPSHVTHLFDNAKADLAIQEKVDVNIGGRPFTIDREFINDLNAQDPTKVLPNIKQSVAIFHSPQDDIVGIDNAALIYRHLSHPKSFISIDGADHLLSAERDSRYVGEMISQWAERYIDVEVDRGFSQDGDVSVSLNVDDAFTCELFASGHHQLADEPKSYGGKELGPTPYNYLLSGLGACTAMTLHMYAKRKKWPLERATVHLHHDKIHAKDCESCDDETKNSSGLKIDTISRKVELVGDLDQEQRQRLLEIADRCPVHKTLEAEVVVKTSLV